MRIDVLVAEIGSTTTVANAFTLNPPVFLAQGQAATTARLGDVTIGLKNAVADMETRLGGPADYDRCLATSSAAGGLKMTVHGLVYDMTVRAAKEAALGAGAVLKFATAGRLTRTDLAKVREIGPNIILVAGGVDFGETETALYNFEKLAQDLPNVPFIYAGNIQNQDEIRLMAEEYGVKVYITENVYPRVDTLNVEPTRKIIQAVFEEHITHAPGMAAIRSMVDGKIMPTPGAVMEAAKLLQADIGDLCVFDVGGATTDIHSVTAGTPEVASMSLSPEPFAKRTVEGDLGVYVNIPHITAKIGDEELLRTFPDAERLMTEARPIPETPEQTDFIEYLCRAAMGFALERHAGRFVDYYGPTGKKSLAVGKDLTAVRWIIGTGGALTRLPARRAMLEGVCDSPSSPRLTPRKGAGILVDNDYIMASLGALAAVDSDAALTLMKRSLGI